MLDLVEFYILGAISIIGIIQWIKHLKIEKLNKFIPYISLVLSLIGGIFAANTFDKLTIWNVFVCFGGMLAVVQLGYESIIKSLGGAIDNFINRRNSKTSSNE